MERVSKQATVGGVGVGVGGFGAPAPGPLGSSVARCTSPPLHTMSTVTTPSSLCCQATFQVCFRRGSLEGREVSCLCLATLCPSRSLFSLVPVLMVPDCPAAPIIIISPPPLLSPGAGGSVSEAQ
ncbi:unnamed protein product [Arctogadus glacialis]